MERRLDELVCRYLDGSASPLEVRQLDEALQHDPEAARTLIEMAALEVELAQTLKVERKAAEMAADGSLDTVAAPPTTKASRPMKPTKPSESGREAWWRSGWIAATLAASLLVAVITWQIVDQYLRSLDTWIAQVVSFEGEVELSLPDGKWRPLLRYDKIEHLGSIRVGSEPGSQVRIKYRDDSELILYPNTEVTLTQRDGGKHVFLAVGQVYANIKPQTDVPKMVFETDDARAVVLGTILQLTRWDGKTVLKTIKGKVRFEKFIQVRTNQYATTEAGKAFAAQTGSPPIFAQPKKNVPRGQFQLPNESVTPSGITSDGWNLWICCGDLLNYEDAGDVPEGPNPKQFVYQLRPIQGAILRRLDLGAFCHEMGATSLTYGKLDGKPRLFVADVWASPNVIHIVDPETGQQVGVLRNVPKYIADLAFGDGQLWCVTRSRKDGTLQEQIHRLSTEDGSVLASVDTPVPDGGFQSLAYHKGHLWLQAVQCGSPGVYKIDPKTGTPVAKFRCIDSTDEDSQTGVRYARVLGMCHDERDQLWMVDAKDKWVRPFKVAKLEKINNAPGRKNWPALRLRKVASEQAAVDSNDREDHSDVPESPPAPPETAPEPPAPEQQSQPENSETRTGRAKSNERQSLTLIGPQLESRIGTPFKVLRSLYLLRGRGTPPNRLISKAHFQGLSILRNSEPLL